MNFPRSAVLCSLLLLLSTATGCRSAGVKRDGDVVILFDGTSMAGWRQAGPGQFHVDHGELVGSGGMGLLWYAERPFRDFTMTLEWRVDEPDDNSGVFVRFPDPGDDPWVAVNEGYELQICDTADPMHNTGSVYSFQAPTRVPTNPAGEWNEYSITVIGQQYTVRVNGEVVNTYVGDRSREGYVGLQNHDDGSPVRFRNIVVHEE
jgi:hypothetical protein